MSELENVKPGWTPDKSKVVVAILKVSTFWMELVLFRFMVKMKWIIISQSITL